MEPSARTELEFGFCQDRSQFRHCARQDLYLLRVFLELCLVLQVKSCEGRRHGRQDRNSLFGGRGTFGNRLFEDLEQVLGILGKTFPLTRKMFAKSKPRRTADTSSNRADEHRPERYFPQLKRAPSQPPDRLVDPHRLLVFSHTIQPIG